ncbi:MAG: chorismate-binding protein, partial [Candidatus Marinimicrobia bacterium]|nr:chorismate-binding protein [Candidatus Neomarinimicrobiota bacterium]
YSHVQHLVSNVTGILKDDLDALHAYLASMNMGTLTGAPKIEAMKLLRKYETAKRGFYGGAVGYFTPGGDFDSCIVIRSMRFKNDHAYIKVGAGIVHDSDPEKEWDETIKKASACLEALDIDIDYESKK